MLPISFIFITSFITKIPSIMTYVNNKLTYFLCCNFLGDEFPVCCLPKIISFRLHFSVILKRYNSKLALIFFLTIGNVILFHSTFQILTGMLTVNLTVGVLNVMDLCPLFTTMFSLWNNCICVFLKCLLLWNLCLDAVILHEYFSFIHQTLYLLWYYVLSCLISNFMCRSFTISITCQYFKIPILLFLLLF
jgi:hypothetical protein